MHRFRDKDAFLQTGNDVMVIPPLASAVRRFRWRILNGWPQVYIMLYWLILSIFNRLRVIRPFPFGWDFPTAGQICGVFWENDPQKVNIPKNTSLRQTASFEQLCVKIGSWVWAVRVARKDKGTQLLYFTTTCGRHRWYDPNQIWQGCWSAYSIIILAKFKNKRFIIVTLVSGWILPF